MKKLLLLLLIFPLFVSCGGDNEEGAADANRDKIRALFNTYGLKPSLIDKIALAEIVDYRGYRIAIGQRNGNAWMAKFDVNGNEVYSKEFPQTYKNIETSYMSGPIRYGAYDERSVYDEAECDILFVYANISDFDFVNGMTSASDMVIEPNSAFLALNLNDGSIIYQDHHTEDDLGKRRYVILSSNNSYLIQAVDIMIGTDYPIYQNITSVYQKGVLWGRNTVEREKNTGIGVYLDRVLIDSERIVFRNKAERNMLKIYNLKTQILEREINTNSMPTLGDHPNDNNYSCESASFFINRKTLYYQYNEIEKIRSVDDLTGNISETIEISGTFYYEVNLDTYSISERKRKP